MKGSNYRDHKDRAENRGKPGNENHVHPGEEVKGEQGTSGPGQTKVEQITDPQGPPVPSEHGGKGGPGA